MLARCTAALRAATRAAALGAMPEEAAAALFTELIARMRRAQVFLSVFFSFPPPPPPALVLSPPPPLSPPFLRNSIARTRMKVSKR